MEDNEDDFTIIDGVQVPYDDEFPPLQHNKWGNVVIYDRKRKRYAPFPGIGMTEEQKREFKLEEARKKNRDRRKERLANGKCSRCGGERDRKGQKQCAKCRAAGSTGGAKAYWTIRIETLKHYGGICACCGESELHFLAIDHTPTAPSRKDHPEQTVNLTRWVYENGFPEGFRILCHNCNMATRYGRQCPHQREITRLLVENGIGSATSAPLPLP